MNTNYYPGPPTFDPQAKMMSVSTRVAAAMKSIYLKMALALTVTGFVAYFLGAAAPGQISAYNSYFLTHGWLQILLIVAEFGLVIGISAGIQRLSSPAASALFYLFAVVNALTLTPIFVIYTQTSIAKTFFITAGTFAAMSIYGYTTKADLSKFGKILMMALIGLIIAMIVNIFTKSSTFDWIISILGVLIFVGLTAWDTQQMKRLAESIPASEMGRLATIGALNLYLDFVNMFIFLLRIFGGRNN